ncbi:MAG: HDIG domain-containing metalloprotein [Candidatus Omnitrophota bacterium]
MPLAKSRLKKIFFAALLFGACYLLHTGWVVAISLFVLAVYFQCRHLEKKATLLNLSLILVIIYAVAYFTLRQGYADYYIPFLAVPLLAMTLLGELEVSFLLCLAAATLVSSVAADIHCGVIFFTSSIFASILTQRPRRRMAIIRIGLLAGLLQAVLFFLAEGYRFGLMDRYILFALNGLACGIIVLGVLPIFEYFFKTVTTISLLELSDFNHPLLQRMILEAPGTYHHSLVVGNLSEAACYEVGANALLARIGAYYHDIGKLQKPEYFSENQTAQESKHDSLSPTMSKMVIMNHVKEGMELANKFKLNPRITDFIIRHHGNSLVYYFYRRALESSEDVEGIKEEGFRYPGPKPNTKETAIVMLADSVEAAMRTLKDHAPASIEEAVHKIINNKFIDRQLDECDLTLKDLEKISAVFIRILSGIYHNRITYPEHSH